jgi:hypothetical protein
VISHISRVPFALWLTAGAVIACAGGQRPTAADLDAAAAVVRAVEACERDDKTCLDKALDAARQVAPRLRTAPAASSSGGGS